MQKHLHSTHIVATFRLSAKVKTR